MSARHTFAQPLGGLALLIAALGLGACRGEDDSGAAHVSGHVEATEVRVATKLSGTLQTVDFEEGDVVARGQVLAQIDTVDVTLALERARAQRGEAEAQLRLLLAGAREEDIAEAEAALARAEADLEGAERELKRMEGLLASGSGTTKTRDDALTRRDVARASVTAASERLRKLKAGSRPEEIERARAAVRAADAAIAQLEQQLEDATIRSPLAGVVTQKLAEAGELVATGAGIAMVTDIEGAWLNVYVGEPSLGALRVGQEIEVRTDGGQSRTGTISFIASEAEFTPKNVQTQDERVKLVYRVKIRLPNEDHLFKPGMPAEAVMVAS